MDVTALLFSFRGRINRALFWWAVLMWMIMALALLLVFLALGLAPDGTPTTSAPCLAAALGVPVLISSLAISARRLHDRGKSSWWLLLFYPVPVLLGVGGAIAGGLWGALAGNAIGVLISIWYLIELGCLRGTPGANAHGPDPLDAMAARAMYGGRR